MNEDFLDQYAGIQDAQSLQGVDVLAAIELGQTGNDSRAYIAAGGLFGAAFMLEVVLALWRSSRGERADYGAVMVRMLLYAFLLGSYIGLADAIHSLVARYGTMSTAKKTVLAVRATSFAANLADNAAKSAEGGWLETGTMVFLERLFEFAVWCTYVFASGVVYALALIQRAALSFLITIGPLFIGLSAFPWKPLRGLFVAWVMATIEIGVWGVAATSLSRLLEVSYAHLAIQSNGYVSQNLAQHFVFNVMYAFAFLAIPLIVNSLMAGRGAPGAIGSVAAMAGAAQGAMVAAAGAAGPLVRQGAASSALAASRRPGDPAAMSATPKSPAPGGATSPAPSQQRPGDK